MATWKRILLTGVGFGLGFAIAIAAIAGAWIWYENRPVKEPDWNTTAIKATFKDVVVTTSLPKPKFTFSYTLENTTQADYSISGTSSDISVMATLPEGKGLEPEEELSLPSNVYIPAKQKVVVAVSREGEYNSSYPEQDRDNAAKLGPYMNRRLRELDGFVIFDKSHRYKVVLPNGWPDVKKDDK